MASREGVQKGKGQGLGQSRGMDCSGVRVKCRWSHGEKRQNRELDSQSGSFLCHPW